MLWVFVALPQLLIRANEHKVCVLCKLDTSALLCGAWSPLTVPSHALSTGFQVELPILGYTHFEAPRKKAKHLLPSSEWSPWLATLRHQLQLFYLVQMEGIRFQLLLNKRCSVVTVCLGSVILLPNTCIYSDTCKRIVFCNSYLCCQIQTTTR